MTVRFTAANLAFLEGWELQGCSEEKQFYSAVKETNTIVCNTIGSNSVATLQMFLFPHSAS